MTTSTNATNRTNPTPGSPDTARPGVKAPGPPSAGKAAAKAAPTAARALPEDARRVLRLRVPLTVRLAHRSMALGEIMRLSPGTLIEFEKPGDSDLELMITDRVIGRGDAVKVGENFGLRITAIGPVRERIRSMGGEHPVRQG